MEELLRADQQVRQRLLAAERTIRKGIKNLNAGESIESALIATRAAERRQDINEVLEVLQLARHNLRIAVIDAGLEEGMSLSEIARGFGISRQLVQRMAKEQLD